MNTLISCRYPSRRQYCPEQTAGGQLQDARYEGSSRRMLFEIFAPFAVIS